MYIYQTKPLASEHVSGWSSMKGVLLLTDKIICWVYTVCKRGKIIGLEYHGISSVFFNIESIQVLLFLKINLETSFFIVSGL